MAVLSSLQEYLAVFGASSAHFVSPLASVLREQLSPQRGDTGTAGASAQRKRKKKATAQEVATSTALRAQEAEKLYSHVELLVARLKSAQSPTQSRADTTHASQRCKASYCMPALFYLVSTA